MIEEASEKLRHLLTRLLETNNELYSAVASEFDRIKNIVVKEYSKVNNGGAYLAQLEKELKVHTGLPRYTSKYREKVIARTAFAASHQRFQLLKPAKTNSASSTWADSERMIKLLGKENSEARTRQTSNAYASSRGSTSSKHSSQRNIEYAFLPNIKISFL